MTIYLFLYPATIKSFWFLLNFIRQQWLSYFFTPFGGLTILISFFWDTLKSNILMFPFEEAEQNIVGLKGDQVT